MWVVVAVDPPPRPLIVLARRARGQRGARQTGKGGRLQNGSTKRNYTRSSWGKSSGFAASFRGQLWIMNRCSVIRSPCASGSTVKTRRREPTTHLFSQPEIGNNTSGGTSNCFWMACPVAGFVTYKRSAQPQVRSSQRQPIHWMRPLPHRCRSAQAAPPLLQPGCLIPLRTAAPPSRNRAQANELASSAEPLFRQIRTAADSARRHHALEPAVSQADRLLDARSSHTIAPMTPTGQGARALRCRPRSSTGGHAFRSSSAGGSHPCAAAPGPSRSQRRWRHPLQGQWPFRCRHPPSRR